MPDEEAEQRADQQHGDQRAGEQPGQVAHAAGDAEFVTNRAQYVIGEEQGEYIQE